LHAQGARPRTHIHTPKKKKNSGDYLKIWNEFPLIEFRSRSVTQVVERLLKHEALSLIPITHPPTHTWTVNKYIK
jgi:hypothetical protein